jgi:hypothetical protein
MSPRMFLILKPLLKALFPLTILAIGVYAFVVSFNYQFETRAFAQGAAVILIILSAALLVRDISREIAGMAVRSESSPARVVRRIPPTVIALAWCVGFFVAAVLIGLELAIPIWLFILLLRTRASKIATILIPSVLWAIVKFGLEYSLDTLLFKGILFGDKLPTFW